MGRVKEILHFWMTRKELDFWKKAGVLSKSTKFGDTCYGAVLTEMKRINTLA